MLTHQTLRSRQFVRRRLLLLLPAGLATCLLLGVTIATGAGSLPGGGTHTLYLESTTGTGGTYSLSPLPVFNNYGVEATSSQFMVVKLDGNTSYSVANLHDDVNGPDFTAALALTISGHLRNVNGRGLNNETVVLSGGASLSTQTDAAGAYSFTVASGGTYNVAPNDSRVSTWLPSNSLDFTNLAQSVSNADFGASFPSFTVTGVVKNSGGTTFPGVNVRITGANITTKDYVTKSGGSYTSDQLNILGDYTFTPQTFTAAGTTYSSFNPTNKSFTGIPTCAAGPGVACSGFDYLGVDFVATAATGVVQFSLANYSQGEAAGPASITVTRTGGSSGAASVQYATVAGGTATGGASCSAGVDYINTSGTVNWADGDSNSKTFPITFCNDSIFEGSETVNLALSNAVGATLGGQSTAALTIVDDETQPTISINDVSLSEGNSGTTNFDFTVSLSNASTQTVTVTYATAEGTATLANNDYQTVSPTLLTFNPGDTSKTLRVFVNGDTVVEPDETFKVNLTNPTNATIARAQGAGNILNDDLVAVMQFSAANYNVGEGNGSFAVTVTRSSNTAGASTVDFATSDGSAKQNSDYLLASGTLNFAAGETSKTFSVLIVDDVFVEANESVNLTLSNATGGTLGPQTTATLTITENDTTQPTTNPLDNSDAQFFVRQQYYDFLSRVPDAGGFAFWTGQITSCNNDQACIRARKIIVSNAFFFELEYQQTAAYVFRLFRGAFGNTQPFANPDATNPAVPVGQQAEALKLPSYAAFARDRAALIGSANLAQDQQALANAFVTRTEFLTKYPANLTLSQFVDTLVANILAADGADLSGQKAALVALGTRGAVMYRAVNDDLAGGNGLINNRAFIDAEYNRSFVASQYYGYLRRDADIGGFLFWLGQVNSAPLRSTTKQSAMVCSFTTALEYQQRFSPVVTHSNAECPQ